ncbi:hypothetical protein ACJX0J_005684 [Zea mays]
MFTLSLFTRQVGFFGMFVREILQTFTNYTLLIFPLFLAVDSDYALFMFYLFALLHALVGKFFLDKLYGMQESQIFYIILLIPIFALHPDSIYSEIYFGLSSGSEGIFIKTAMGV